MLLCVEPICKTISGFETVDTTRATASKRNSAHGTSTAGSMVLIFPVVCCCCKMCEGLGVAC
ncbi:hypothetical protein PsYK624_148590 [Phanerochaete sordida]|uniref:Uncharacterized protein n=1 Tax=Phanerochaete sordida TaxID=48140 RepID=A0A9P3GSF0_9APHY|nr:hypothetical protein PsYK624_148590 [Phanerochaete sordida]